MQRVALNPISHAAFRAIDFPGQPYALAGVGVYRLKYRLDALQPTPSHLIGGQSEGTRGGVSLGAGVSTHVTRGWRLGGEAVYHRLFLSGATPAFFTVGATLIFGAPK